MHPKFISILCCPVNGSELGLKIEELFENGMVKTGILISSDGRTEYPIINGIPRFVSKEFYAGSFGYEWRKWPRVQFESENMGGPMEGHTTRMFKVITGLREEELKDKMVIEFGCGPGRFLDVVRRWNGIAVGIDMSIAVESARENFRDDENVFIVQGDILNPPFKKNVFDFGYTIGVLHHTPDPKKGLKKLSEIVKSKGQIACCVYHKKGFYDYFSVFLFRQVNKLNSLVIGKRFATKISLAYAYFAAYVLYFVLKLMRKIPLLGRPITSLIEKYLLVNLELPDIRWRILDVFDAITPSYASTHTAAEVRQWFMDANCDRISQTNWGNASFVATKK